MNRLTKIPPFGQPSIPGGGLGGLMTETSTSENYQLCRQWITEAYKNHKNRIEKTDTDTRLVYQFFYSNEEYPFYVVSTHIDYGMVVQLTRYTEKLDDNKTSFVYMSQLGAPTLQGGKINITFDSPEVYKRIRC